MLIPKKHRNEVYRTLFKDGVLVAKKDFFAPKHHNLDVPNLHVIKLLQSLKSRGFVKETFSWQWYYWYLTNEGINFLREYLHLAEEVVPSTMKKARLPSRPSSFRGSDRGDRGDRGDRPPRRFDDKKTGPPADFQASQRGDEGRGAGRGRGFGGRTRTEGGRGFGRGQPTEQ